MAYDIGYEPRTEPEDYDVPICPIWGAECETIYKDCTGEIVGCDGCITIVDAWEASA